jgi:hypothetical protein
MKNQRRFAPTKTGRLAPEQVAAFLRNQWPELAEYTVGYSWRRLPFLLAKKLLPDCVRPFSIT